MTDEAIPNAAVAAAAMRANFYLFLVGASRRSARATGLIGLPISKPSAALCRMLWRGGRSD